LADKLVGYKHKKLISPQIFSSLVFQMTQTLEQTWIVL